jgi:phosphoribosylamine--glycine ligase
MAFPPPSTTTFTDARAGRACLRRRRAARPIVVKADGLAAGKGVVVADSGPEAHAAIDMMLLDSRMGDAGARRRRSRISSQGEEASFIVMVDGSNVLALATSQDHKRLLDGDAGPQHRRHGRRTRRPRWSRPTLHAARACARSSCPPSRAWPRRHPFTGFLYAGLMIDGEGRPRTLEFNCRMGDPETQPIMMRMNQSLLRAHRARPPSTARLEQVEIEWDRRTALGVVIAAHGYPDDAAQGRRRSHGLPEHGNPGGSDTLVFHAGHHLERDGSVAACGGRVLCVTALGDGSRSPSPWPTRRSRASASTACSSGATSAIAPESCRDAEPDIP